MQAVLLITYREIRKREPSYEDLDEILRKYERREVVTLFASLNCILRTCHNTPDFELDAELSSVLLPALRFEIAAMRAAGPPRLLFSRITLLFLMKRACLVCPETGLLPKGPSAQEDLGLCGLMANDLLLPFAPSPTDNTLTKLANIFPFVDYVPRDQYPFDIARTQMMFDDICQRPEMTQRGDYVDLSGLFRNVFGLTVVEFSELMFACFTRVQSVTREQFDSSPDTIFLRSANFLKTIIPQATISGVLEKISISEAELAEKMHGARSRPADDFTLLQKFPLIKIGVDAYVCLDPGFLLDKAGRGTVWTLVSEIADVALQQRVLSFWGAVFEEYVNHIFAQSYSSGGRLIPGPRFSNGDQAFDACLLEGRNLIVLEHKSSTLRGEAKYGGDVHRLKEELDSKFIEGDADGAKGLAQLTKGISRFLSGEDVENVDRCKVDRIYPALICLDYSITVPLVGRYFNERFYASFPRKKFKQVVVTPVFTIGISDLENLAGYLGSLRACDILECYYAGDKSMMIAMSSARIPILLRAKAGNT